MGIFGLTIAESHGGSGMAKQAMCVVSEELSRGYLGVGSLATRSEIAAELVAGGGTEAQKRGMAAGNCLGGAAANRRLHRTGRRLRSGQPADPAERDGQHYRITAQQDLDHPCGAGQPDDAHCPDRSGLDRLPRSVDVPGAKDARRRCRTLPRYGAYGRRDTGDRLSRDAGIRARPRPPAGGGIQPARQQRGQRFQAVDGDLRIGPHPDRGQGNRGGAIGARMRPGPCHRQGAVRPGAGRGFPGSLPSWR